MILYKLSKPFTTNLLILASCLPKFKLKSIHANTHNVVHNLKYLLKYEKLYLFSDEFNFYVKKLYTVSQ